MLIYLHGLNSSPASHKAQQLRREMELRGLDAAFLCPELKHIPAAAIALIEGLIERHSDVSITLVGSSLGGFYATYLAEKHDLRAVLLNPVVRPQGELERYLGPQRNLYSGEEYELTPTHIAQWRALEVAHIEPKRYLLVVETGDEVLDYRQAVLRYRGAQQVVIPGGDHSLQSFSRHIPLILGFAGLPAL